MATRATVIGVADVAAPSFLRVFTKVLVVLIRVVWSQNYVLSSDSGLLDLKNIIFPDILESQIYLAPLYCLHRI